MVLSVLPSSLSIDLQTRFVPHLNAISTSSLRERQHGMEDLKALALGEIARPIHQMEQSRLLTAAFTPFASR